MNGYSESFAKNMECFVSYLSLFLPWMAEKIVDTLLFFIMLVIKLLGLVGDRWSVCIG